MKKRTVAVLGGFLMLATYSGLFLSGVKINTTKSIPLGVYWESEEPVKKGAYVLWCPPKSDLFDDAKNRGYVGGGFCPGGYGYLMKRILAAENDVVTVDEGGVFVNGELLDYSKPKKADGAGRPMPEYRINRYTLKQGELLFMSDVSKTSFDGRYYGLVDAGQVVTVIEPVFTW